MRCRTASDVRILGNKARREVALEIAQLFAQRRRALLEVGKRRILARRRHGVAGGGRIGERAQLLFHLGDILVGVAQRRGEVARLRQHLALLLFHRSDVVPRPKGFHLAPLVRHVVFQLFFTSSSPCAIDSADESRNASAKCSLIRVDDRGDERRQHLGTRSRGYQFHDVRIGNRNRLEMRLHVRDGIGPALGKSLARAPRVASRPAPAPGGSSESAPR